MEKIATIKNEYNSLDKLLKYLEKESEYDCSINHDKWEVRRDSNGKIQQCILIKKSAMHGLQVFFLSENKIEISHTIPNMLLYAYLGKSKQQYRRIDEIVIGKIKDLLLVNSQKKAFNEMEQVFEEITIQ
ncbi:hypothetical protein [Aquimarina sp. 2201CG5-10]|uniref:hypothetical protein n=1 Tax=Aquimarina callyspongiae TaxID=3098150 RepID=UPI002AB540C4|nr:hypothetical protein [Aquimarina sp. 2201CG5-10]MDY8136250.1 hypothetical protein [Aquimarina sp. 2201CG5-10]